MVVVIGCSLGLANSLRTNACAGSQAVFTAAKSRRCGMTPSPPQGNAATAAQRRRIDQLQSVADPKAVVVLGNARFTVLTPQLIRMEWAADGKFEDHASFVFLNRHLPVPEFYANGLR